MARAFSGKFCQPMGFRCCGPVQPGGLLCQFLFLLPISKIGTLRAKILAILDTATAVPLPGSCDILAQSQAGPRNLQQTHFRGREAPQEVLASVHTLHVQQAAEEHFGQTVADQPFNPERLVRRSLGSKGNQWICRGVVTATGRVK